jgi:hypothetical protein
VADGRERCAVAALQGARRPGCDATLDRQQERARPLAGGARRPGPASGPGAS